MKKVVITIMCVMLASLSLFFISCGKKHDLVKVERTEATCETDGNIEYYKCNECDKWFTDETAETEITDKSTVVIAKLGHDYDLDNGVWTWTEYELAEITFTCKRDATHKKEVSATIEKEVTQAATCEEKGLETYTATAEFGGKTFTDVKTKEIEAIGHNYDTENIVWAWTDFASATATFTCKNDATHVEVVNATITNAVTTEPTCTATGVKTYTATVTFNEVTYTDTKTEELAMIPHTLTKHDAVGATCSAKGNIEYWTCDECGKYFADGEGVTEITENETVTEIVPHEFVDGVCKYCGKAAIDLPMVSSNEKIKGELITGDKQGKTFRYTYSDGVMNFVEPYSLTIPVEVVNETLKQGYDSFMIYFSRDGLKATSFDINGTGDNAGAKLQLSLTKDTPLVIENITILNICDEGWAGDGYSEADSYIVRIVYNKVFDKADPMTYMYFTQDTTYKDEQYSFTLVEGKAMAVIRKEYVKMLSETYDRFVVRVNGSGALTISYGETSFVQPMFVTMMFNPFDFTGDICVYITGSPVDVTVEIIGSKKFDPADVTTYFAYDAVLRTKEGPDEEGYMYFDYEGWHDADDPANRVDNKAYLKAEYISYLKDNYKDTLKFRYSGGNYQYIIYDGNQTVAPNANTLVIDVTSLPDDKDILIVTGSSHQHEKNISLTEVTTKYFPEKPETKLSFDVETTYTEDGAYIFNAKQWSSYEINVTAGYIKELKDAGVTTLKLTITGGGTIYLQPKDAESHTGVASVEWTLNLADFDGTTNAVLTTMSNAAGTKTLTIITA